MTNPKNTPNSSINSHLDVHTNAYANTSTNTSTNTTMGADTDANADIDTDTDTYADTYVSRSQKKRDSTALQRAGAELAALTPALWKTMPIPKLLLQALQEYKNLKKHEAKRRHMQYIGRLMREETGVEAVLEALERYKNNTQRGVTAFKHLEDLRELLVHEQEEVRKNAFMEALDTYPNLNSKEFSHIVEAAFMERQKKRPPRHYRELFRILKNNAETKQEE